MASSTRLSLTPHLLARRQPARPCTESGFARSNSDSGGAREKSSSVGRSRATSCSSAARTVARTSPRSKALAGQYSLQGWQPERCARGAQVSPGCERARNSWRCRDSRGSYSKRRAASATFCFGDPIAPKTRLRDPSSCAITRYRALTSERAPLPPASTDPSNWGEPCDQE